VDETSPNAGQRLFRFTGLDEFAAFNGFSPDGKIVYVGGYYGEKIWFYTLPVDELVVLARFRLTRGWAEDECQKYLRLDKCP
jgi:hypothetical protein